MYKEILEKTLKKYGKNFTQILKKIDENLGKFSRQFWEKFTKLCKETSNNLRQKIQRNPEEILEIFGALLSICPRALQSLIRHRCAGIPITETFTDIYVGCYKNKGPIGGKNRKMMGKL